MLRRVLSSLVLVPLLAALIGWGPAWAFALVLAGVIALGIREWFGMLGRPTREALPAIVLALLLAAGLHSHGEGWFGPFLAILPVALALLSLSLRDDPPLRLAKVGETALALLFVALPLSFFILLRALPDGRKLVFLLLIVLWCADTAAYLVGVRFGKRRMSPVLSPKKSYEGLAGCVAAGALAGWFLAPPLAGLEALPGAGLGALLALLGQAGDLFESLWKRARGVKDSGTLIPGHGGILDRVDSFLLTAPVLYLLMLRFLTAGCLMGDCP